VSRSLRLLLVGGLLLLQLVAITAVGTRPVYAGVGPADDRQISTPTNWWTYRGLTASQVKSYLSANSARLTGIQVESSTPTFTVTMIANSSPYKVDSWWYSGLTEAQVNDQLAAHLARPISMSAYSTSSGVRYAVVMVSNSAGSHKASWWYHGSATFIAQQLTAHSARLIELSPFPGGGFVALMVDNTGTNATHWWWYHGISAANVTADLSSHSARLVDLSRTKSGKFNAVMYRDTKTRWYWFRDLSAAAAVNRAAQLGERIIDVTSYSISGTKYLAVVMTENLDATSRQLFTVISPHVDSGAYGFSLKRVGGSTLAGLEQTKQFEPAGALALLYHAKSIHQESSGLTTDGTIITYRYNNLADPNDGQICPDDFPTTTTTNLKNADTLMMQRGDYRMARGILEKYTKTAILTYAQTLGLNSTVINRSIGCPASGTPNTSTLVDLGKVYEAFGNGTVTTDGTWQGQFRSRMLNQANDATKFQSLFCRVVNQEASKLGKSAATATAFCNAATWIATDGSYQYAAGWPSAVSRTQVSLTSVPYKKNGTLAPRSFAFGTFVDGTTVNSQQESDGIDAAQTQLYRSAFRPLISAALKTW
jgi:hypothetical protein